MNIIEIFHSLQGEGADIGLPSVFIRCSGCNLKCEWCDTKYAWGDGEEKSVEEVVEEVEDYAAERVCITGGEPLLQDDLDELIDELLRRKKRISVQTNGSLDISDLVDKDVSVSMDYKTPSSAMEDEMLEENIDLLREGDELKFVIADKKDLEYAVEILKEHVDVANVIFQPEGGKDLKELAETVLEKELDVRVLPQLHKLIWGDRRGV